MYICIPRCCGEAIDARTCCPATHAEASREEGGGQEYLASCMTTLAAIGAPRRYMTFNSNAQQSDM